MIIGFQFVADFVFIFHSSANCVPGNHGPPICSPRRQTGMARVARQREGERSANRSQIVANMEINGRRSKDWSGAGDQAAVVATFCFCCCCCCCSFPGCCQIGGRKRAISQREMDRRRRPAVPLLPYLLRFLFNDGSSIDLAGCESWQPHLLVHLQIRSSCWMGRWR